MRHLLSILLFISCSLKAISQNTGIGVGTANPHSSAAFEVMDSARGFLPPRMTYIKRNTISNPATGLIVFCTDCGTVGEMQYFNGYEWISMALAIGSAPLVITTYPFTSVSYYSAFGSGNISYSNPISPFTSRGICWSTSPNPTVESSSSTIDNGYGAGTFYNWLRNLSPGTTYFARAYAGNSYGKVYGNQISFTTPTLTLANVITADVSGITSNSAVSGGNITDSGGVAVSSRGVCWSTSPNPTVSLITKTVNGSGIGVYTSNITDLSPGTTYFCVPMQSIQ